MAELIEIVCECGKVLKVPKSRGGQTGRCSRCHRSVSIPISSSDDAPSPSDMAEELSAPLTKEKLDKTTIRMSPFREANLNTTSFNNISSQATSQDINIGQGGRAQGKSSTARFAASLPTSPLPLRESHPSMTTETPFLAPEQTYNEDNFFSRKEKEVPVSTGYMETIQAPTPFPATKEEGKACSRCGSINPTELEKCQYCGESFYVEVASAKNEAVAVSTQTSKFKVPKATIEMKPAKKRSPKIWVVSLITFILGLSCGFALGIFLPRYKSYSAEKQILDSTNAEKTLVEKTSDSPANKIPSHVSEIPKETPPELEIELRQHNPKLQNQVDEAVRSIKVYLYALQGEHRNLQNKLDELSSLNPTISPAKAKGADMERKQMESGLNQRLQETEKLMREKNWKGLEEHYNKKLKLSLNPKDSKVIKNLQEAVQEVSDILAKEQERLKTKVAPIQSPYMGNWYNKLREETSKIKKLGEKNFRFSSDKTSEKFYNKLCLVIMKETDRYAQEIQEIGNRLHKSKTPDIHTRIQWRKDNYQTISQKEQADILEKFLQTNKFDVKLDKQLAKLQNAVSTLERDAVDMQLSEDSVQKVCEVFQEIQKEYDEEKRNFDSAVYSFKEWVPK